MNNACRRSMMSDATCRRCGGRSTNACRRFTVNDTASLPSVTGEQRRLLIVVDGARRMRMTHRHGLPSIVRSTNACRRSVVHDAACLPSVDAEQCRLPAVGRW
jgi:hypothetical protein